ncbi:uncharacterized protein LOC111395018 [Olea europaea var. sylvestris]|uniref:uncharacterized protein LOC111395018 n=1 Tax=Olea europaea var. sylvestris TaxID=158386 RepID=UPI000C1D07EB|nr:uncharacterized protein LOC111395018 [Olea europaea var. sylvestris]
MTSKRLGEIRERSRVPHYVEMLVPEAHERACYPRLGCVAVSKYLFKADSSTRFELSREEFEVIEDIYKRPPKLHHFDHLIDRSRYFLDFELMPSKDKFKRKEYPVSDMASILKATSTVKVRPLKPVSSGAKEVQGRVERLSKDSTSWASKEGTPQRPEKSKEPRGKEKVPEEPKKRKLVHVSSSSGKFGTSVSHEGKEVGQLKLLEAASKAIKIEMVRRVEAEEAREEAARRQAEVVEEEAAKQRPARVQGKSPSFLVKREEPFTPALVEALPPEIRGATKSFYKFWTDRWEALTDFQTRTTALERKTGSLAKELKAAKAKAKIEALKREVHECQCEVASLTKKVKVSNDHQKVTAKALEKANLALASSQEAYQFLEGQIKWYVDDTTKAREEDQEAKEEAVKDYIANFHNIEEYKSFSTYWRNFAYAEVMERAEELYPNQDLSQLRSEFVDEEPQTPADEAVGDEVAEAEEANSDAQATEVPAAEAHPSSSQAQDIFLFSYS